MAITATPAALHQGSLPLRCLASTVFLKAVPAGPPPRPAGLALSRAASLPAIPLASDPIVGYAKAGSDVLQLLGFDEASLRALLDARAKVRRPTLPSKCLLCLSPRTPRSWCFCCLPCVARPVLHVPLRQTALCNGLRWLTCVVSGCCMHDPLVPVCMGSAASSAALQHALLTRHLARSPC